jgi:hypothetical protein
MYILCLYEVRNFRRHFLSVLYERNLFGTDVGQFSLLESTAELVNIITRRNITVLETYLDLLLIFMCLFLFILRTALKLKITNLTLGRNTSK